MATDHPKNRHFVRAKNNSHFNGIIIDPPGCDVPVHYVHDPSPPVETRYVTVRHEGHEVVDEPHVWDANRGVLTKKSADPRKLHSSDLVKNLYPEPAEIERVFDK